MYYVLVLLRRICKHGGWDNLTIKEVTFLIYTPALGVLTLTSLAICIEHGSRIYDVSITDLIVHDVSLILYAMLSSSLPVRIARYDARRAKKMVIDMKRSATRTTNSPLRDLKAELDMLLEDGGIQIDDEGRKRILGIAVACNAIAESLKDMAERTVERQEYDDSDEKEDDDEPPRSMNDSIRFRTGRSHASTDSPVVPPEETREGESGAFIDLSRFRRDPPHRVSFSARIGVNHPIVYGTDASVGDRGEHSQQRPPGERGAGPWGRSVDSSRSVAVSSITSGDIEMENPAAKYMASAIRQNFTSGNGKSTSKKFAAPQDFLVLLDPSYIPDDIAAAAAAVLEGGPALYTNSESTGPVALPPLPPQEDEQENFGADEESGDAKIDPSGTADAPGDGLAPNDGSYNRLAAMLRGTIRSAAMTSPPADDDNNNDDDDDDDDRGAEEAGGDVQYQTQQIVGDAAYDRLTASLQGALRSSRIQ
jgi:hypothetical protein